MLRPTWRKTEAPVRAAHGVPFQCPGVCARPHVMQLLINLCIHSSTFLGRTSAAGQSLSQSRGSMSWCAPSTSQRGRPRNSKRALSRPSVQPSPNSTRRGLMGCGHSRAQSWAAAQTRMQRDAAHSTCAYTFDHKRCRMHTPSHALTRAGGGG